MPRGFKKDGSYAGKVFQKGQVSPNKGKRASIKLKEKMSESQKKAWSDGKYTKERNEKIRKSMSKLYAEGKLKIGSMKLSKHPNWKGGVSFVYHTERQILMGQSKYKIWRELVFIRDNWTCQECGQRGHRLEVHHKKSWRDYQELRFDVSNGKTLCLDCHLDIHRQIKCDDIELKLRKKYG